MNIKKLGEILRQDKYWFFAAASIFVFVFVSVVSLAI